MVYLLSILKKNLLKSLGAFFVCMLVVILGTCSSDGTKKGQSREALTGKTSLNERLLLYTDKDGIIDTLDNCPLVANLNQLYTNGTADENDCLIESIARIDTNSMNGPNLLNEDLFGHSVAYLGDLDGVAGPSAGVLAVGATGDDTGGYYKGAVYLLYLNVDGSVQKTIAINNNTANAPPLSTGDFFGSSVAYLGDLDGVGPSIGVLAVGASGDNSAGLNRGAIHLLYLNVDGSVQQTITINGNTINGPILANDDYFGHSVAYLGDLDGAGLSIGVLAVGATGDDTGGTYRGAVHLLYLNADGSVQQTIVVDSNTIGGPILANNDYFGHSVVYLGDLDDSGPSVGVLAVGAIGTEGSDRAAVHLLYLSTAGNVQKTVTINNNTANISNLADSNYFGYSMAYLGDLDGSGRTAGLLAVGAISSNSISTNNKDRVYLLYLHSDGTIEKTVRIDRQTIGGPDLAANDYFGIAIAWLGDLSSDDPSSGVLAIGAYGNDTGGNKRGALHLTWLE